MSNQTGEQFLSIGGVAEALGVSRSGLRKLERLGVIPPAARLIGSDRRLYRLDDLEVIRATVNERAAKRQRGGQELVAS